MEPPGPAEEPPAFLRGAYESLRIPGPLAKDIIRRGLRIFDRITDGYGNTVSPRTLNGWGRSDVSMPTAFYYILMRTKSGNSRKSLANCSADEIKCAVLLRAHTNDLKGQKVTKSEMMSVSDLEKLTGETYFPNVPNAPKSTLNPSDWGL